MTHNQGVVGSCPTGPTLIIKELQEIVTPFFYALARFLQGIMEFTVGKES